MKKEMLINVLQPEECRIAIVEDGVLEELYVERTSHESYTGNIYKGKIVNLEPAIQAAFVDFSVGRNGFLHISDVEPQYFQRQQQGSELEAPAREPRRDREDRRRPRGEERDPSSPPPSPRGEDRHRDRERPDLSTRGRRDRSEPRRFGEGLTEEELAAQQRATEPSARPQPDHSEPRRRRRPPPPPHPTPGEPRRGRTEPGPSGWPAEEVTPRAPLPESRAIEPDE